jgi:hypothetical protein
VAGTSKKPLWAAVATGYCTVHSYSGMDSATKLHGAEALLNSTELLSVSYFRLSLFQNSREI